MCFWIAAAMVLLVIVGLFQGKIVYAANATVITYEFLGENKDKPGYAQGMVTLNAAKAGTYFLYWADDRAALEGYFAINNEQEFEMEAGSSETFTFGYHTAIPAGATKIIAVTDTDNLSVSSAEAVFTLPESKRLESGSGNLLYTFNSYSDVHIDADVNGSVYYSKAAERWGEALEYAVYKDTDFIVSSGDMVTNASGPSRVGAEWEIYSEVLAASDYTNPVWETNGNHDMRTEDAGKLDDGFYEGNMSYLAATGTEDSSTIANYDDLRPYYYVVEQNTGDIFIFMALENGYSVNAYDNFSQEQIEWLKDLLDTYYGTGVNIYIVEHATIQNFGPGDRWSAPYYHGHMQTEKDESTGRDFPQNRAFKEILTKYKDLIWMAGHTHEDFNMGYNYSDENNTACSMIHNSAVVGSTRANSADNALDYKNGVGFVAQGYYVETYENSVVYYGADLTQKKIYPAYCYIMEGARDSEAISGDGERNIIQPIYENIIPTKELFPENAALTEALDTAETVLNSYYGVASYDQYQMLKKLYQENRNSISTEENTRLVAEFKALCEKVYTLADHVGMKERVTYYFENTNDWSKVNCYAWTGSDYNAEWPGVAMEKVGTNNGHALYRITFDKAAQYHKVIFNDGTNQTIDIPLITYGGNCFYLTGSQGYNSKYKVGCQYYNTGDDSLERYIFCYYKKDSHEWNDFDTIYKCQEDGTYTYSYVAHDTTSISLNVYDNINKKYNCVAASQAITWEDEFSQSYSLTPGSSRGSSITINGLSPRAKIKFVYNPNNNTLSVSCTK